MNDEYGDEIEPLLALVPALRGKAIGVVPLCGGITNRNYRLDADGESFVLRLSGKRTELLSIDRAVEHACSAAAAQAGVGAEVIAFLPEHGALVTRFVVGRVLAPRDAQRPEVLRRIVTALRRYHDGPPGAGAFSPFATVRSYYALACRHGVAFPASMARALALLDAIEAELGTAEPACPCHNDLLPANFIDTGAELRIIDWEYAGMGDRFFDLGNLAVNHELRPDDERQLLGLYFGHVKPEHVRRLGLMKLASDMRESLWGYLQAGISTLDIDFLGYGARHLQRFLDNAPLLEIGPAAVATGGSQT